MSRPFPFFATAMFAALSVLKCAAEVSPGEILISEMNCTACHAATAPVAKRLASRQSPRVGAQGERVTPQWLRAFLENPQATQPGTLMPDALHALPAAEKSAAADALTHFLISLQTPDSSPQREVNVATMEMGKRLYHDIGCVMCHAPADLPAGNVGDTAARDELARLQQVSVPLGELARKYPVAELAAFLRDPLKTRPSGRMPGMGLTEPESDALAMWLARAQAGEGSQSPMLPLGHETFAVDTAKAARGKELFAQFGCANCHAGTDVLPWTARAFASLKSRQPAGCISPVAKPGVPRFELTDRQRVVIQAALGSQEVLDVPLEPAQQIRRTMTVLNCYACHSRDRRGGADGLRREYLIRVGATDLGEEGRIPPSLTGTGAKLRPEWMHHVLIEGVTVRPYMATRMPLFGEANVGHLPMLFDAVDTRLEASPEPDVAGGDLLKIGRTLVGTSGLSCITCHSFAGHQSLGQPGLDLSTAAQHLKWDWFRRYLLDPQSLRSGTRMPAFWAEGAATNNLAGGDKEKQILAIWSYLARRDFTELPEGMAEKRR